MSSSTQEYKVAPFINALHSSDETFKENTSLGNVLFKLASSYAISKMTGRTLSNFYIKLFCERLKTICKYDHGDTIFRYFLNDTMSDEIPTVFIYEKTYYDPNIIKEIEESKEECVGIDSLLIWPSYFLNYRDDILSIFSIPEFMLESFKQNFPFIFDPTITPVSIHMRLNETSVPIADDVQTIYYNLAVKHILKTVSNPRFFLFSDNLTKAQEILTKTNVGTIVHFLNQYDYHDLYLISLCHHHITSASTFSWWGSYLSNHPNKIIIYPRYYYNHLSALGISYEDFHKEYYSNNAVCI